LQASHAADPGPTLNPAAVAEPVKAPSGTPDEFERLQRRLLLATLLLSCAVALITLVAFGSSVALSLSIGACCGLLYLRLLARSVARLGNGSKSLSRFQILVPAVLVIACTRIPALELLPALLGFVLYKPALLLQAVLAP
jgi:ATP synthase protein I